MIDAQHDESIPDSILRWDPIQDVLDRVRERSERISRATAELIADERARLEYESANSQESLDALDALIRQVRDHPDFVFGTVFTRQDMTPDASNFIRARRAPGEEWLFRAGVEYIQMMTPGEYVDYDEFLDEIADPSPEE